MKKERDKKLKSIIYITSRRLLPLNSGDKLLSYNILKRLSSIYNIYLFNFNEGSAYSNEEIEKINKISVSFKTIHLTKKNTIYKLLRAILFNKRYLGVFSAQFTHDLKIYLESNADVEYVVWDHERSSSFFSSNKFKNILIEHNNETNIMKGRIEIFKNTFIKNFIQKQIQHTKEYMNFNHNRMDRIVYLNKNDFFDFAQEHPEKYILMDKLIIDFEHKPYIVDNKNQKIHLLFVGSLDWYPNIEAIEWFLDEVLPILNDQNKYHLNIIGRNPNKKLSDKINSFSNVTLYSNVPSVEEYYLNSDIVVIPIRSGSGINIKVLEALSYGIPTVMTTFAKRGYDGLGFIPSADDAESFSKKIDQLKDIDKRKDLHKKELLYYDNYQQSTNTTLTKVFNSF